jgi:hypothetical protein
LRSESSPRILMKRPSPESVSSEIPGIRCSASARLTSGSLIISLSGCTSMMLGASCFISRAAARVVVALGTTVTFSPCPAAVVTRPMSVSVGWGGGWAGVVA